MLKGIRNLYTCFASLGRLCQNSKYRLVSARHAGSPIKLRTGLIRHPVSEQSEKALDYLRGEFIEPRVKPGMTKIGWCVVLKIVTQPPTGGNAPAPRCSHGGRTGG
jgi:hypothetical protein